MLGRLIIIPLLFLGCGPIERYGRGDIREVVVVFDGAKEEAFSLKEYLEQKFMTPHEEKLFYVYPIEAEQFEGYKGYKNVIILAIHHSKADSILQGIFGGITYGMYKAKDVFLEGDLVIGIVGTSRASLAYLLENEKDKIREILINRVEDFYLKKAYFGGHDPSLRKEVRDKYGYDIDFPSGWGYVVKEPDFLCFAKHYPDRFFFIYRTRGPKSIDPENLLNLRDKLTEVYYEGDRVDHRWYKARRTKFNGQDACEIYGIWQNDSLVRGGPFKLIAFNLRDKFYMIDMAVFAPQKRKKLEYIMRMELFLKKIRILQ